MPERKYKFFFLLKFRVKSVFIKNYFIGFCASLWYLSSVSIWENHLSIHHYLLSLTLLLGTILMYNIDRLFGDEWHLIKTLFSAKNTQRTTFNKTHAKVAFQLLFLIPLIALLPWIEKAVLMRLIFPGIVAFIYAIPLFPNKVRLRELPFVKIFTIAFVWGWLGAFLNTEVSMAKAWWLFIERFLFIYAITIPFDLRDQVVDGEQQIRTVPRHLGIKGSIYSAVLALMVALLVNVLFHPGSHLPMAIAAAIAALLILNWKPSYTWKYYLLGLDGTIIILSGLVLIAEILA